MTARPPAGYASLPVSSSQILLPLTISNKCGQSFRWRGVDVYDVVKHSATETKVEAGKVPMIKQEDELPAQVVSQVTRVVKSVEWSICLDNRVVFVRQDEERGFLYHKTMLPGANQSSKEQAVIRETADWLADYLNLQVPLAEFYEEWSDKDEVFRRFAKRFTGVRMLRQDPWECLCS